MEKVRLGKTNLLVGRTSFGALPIQRVSMDEAVKILKSAYDGGVNFFDTARSYSDSEEKLGKALSPVRDKIIIATKTPAKTKAELFNNLTTSLKMLRTDYIDIYQLHNPDYFSDLNDKNELYEGLLEAKEKGYVRHIGVTYHKIDLALTAAQSGLYETVQFPLNVLSSKKDLTLIKACKKNDVGLIAMKAMSGGLLTNAKSAFAFLRQFDNLVPIWGIQRMSELNEFIGLENNPPVLDEELSSTIDKDRRDLSGDFCRGCGYCLPCPAGIPIPTAARISLFMTRAPYKPFLSDEWKENMDRINNCISCGHCKSNCPYELDTPELLKANLKFYNEFYEKHKLSN